MRGLYTTLGEVSTNLHTSLDTNLVTNRTPTSQLIPTSLPTLHPHQDLWHTLQVSTREGIQRQFWTLKKTRRKTSQDLAHSNEVYQLINDQMPVLKMAKSFIIFSEGKV